MKVLYISLAISAGATLSFSPAEFIMHDLPRKGKCFLSPYVIPRQIITGILKTG